MRLCCGLSLRQFVECVVESDQVHAASFQGERIVEFQPDSAIALAGVAGARILDQNLSHQLGADGEKVPAILDGSSGLLLQAQIGLVYQGGALQSVAGPFIAEVVVREAAQFVIDEGNRGF